MADSGTDFLSRACTAAAGLAVEEAQNSNRNMYCCTGLIAAGSCIAVIGNYIAEAAAGIVVAVADTQRNLSSTVVEAVVAEVEDFHHQHLLRAFPLPQTFFRAISSYLGTGCFFVDRADHDTQVVG